MCSDDDLLTNKQRPYYGLVIGKYCTNCLSIYLNSQFEKKSIALITTISSKKSQALAAYLVGMLEGAHGGKDVLKLL